MASSQATLFFSPSLALPKLSQLSDAEDDVSKRDPLVWAEGLLTSKEAVDMLCKRIERSETERKDAALRAACLLTEGKRVMVQHLPNSCLQLRVTAEDPALATMLCDGLIAYLSFKTKIPLEDPDRDPLTNAENELRTKERDLSQGLWNVLAFDSLKSPSEKTNIQDLQSDLIEYQSSMANYRNLLTQNFFRETWSAADNPGFVVIEPPFGRAPEPVWYRFAGLGALLGAAIGWVWDRKQRPRPPKYVPWRSQEARPEKRTGSSDG